MLKLSSKKLSFFTKRFLQQSLLLKIIILILITAVVWFAYSKFNSNKNKTSYQTAQVTRGSIISSVSASGQVLTVNIMSANTKASGIVKTVFVKDGDIVQKGAKILEIDLDFQGQQKYAQAWASYLSAKNNLETAKINGLTNQSEMFSKWKIFYDLATSSTYQNSDGSPNYTNRALAEFHIAENNWLAAEAKYKNQQSLIAQAEAALNSSWLEYTLVSPIITAPTSGTITSLTYAPGMSIGSLDTGTTSSNQKVATIKTAGNPIISVNLSEIDVYKVQIDQKATITFDSIPDKTFTGKVIGVDRIGVTISGVTQYPANIRLDTSSDQILPNMTVTANIISDKKDNVLIIPSSAIRSENGQTFVQTLKNGKPQSIPVITGLTSDTETEIISGLKEGDIVITGTTSITTPRSSQSGSSPFSGFGGGTFRIRRD